MVYIFALFLIIYVLCCLVLVGFILTQEGKGGGLSGVMGASMGETFGFGGATTTIRKFTSIAAAVFLAFTIVLTFLGERVVNQYSNAFLAAEGAAPAAATRETGSLEGRTPLNRGPREKVRGPESSSQRLSRSCSSDFWNFAHGSSSSTRGVNHT